MVYLFIFYIKDNILETCKTNPCLWWQMILPIAVEDVKREVKILQALAGHENVVKFYNAFEDDNYVYIAME